MAETATRSARLEARIAPDALQLVKKAAELEGRSVSDFVVSAAQEAARRTIEGDRVIRLSAQVQSQFVDALLTPPEPAEALRRARHAHEALIVRSK